MERKKRYAVAMIRSLALAAFALTFAAPAQAAPPARNPRVALKTSVGTIVVEVDTRHAPITGANFLKYVDLKKFDGTTFYRSARAKNAPKQGFIQGGIRHSFNRMLPPIAHEPTTKTGIRHLDGTISLARDKPGTAMGDFFIMVGSAPSLDAHPGAKGDNLGYAAFGNIVGGMDVVHRILALPTVQQIGSGAMKNQMLTKPITIVSAARVK